jgi:hypothetical protein
LLSVVLFGLKNKIMVNPKIKTRVVHSESKDAWNIIGENIGNKHKIARVPYLIIKNEVHDTLAKNEALNHALFISRCFNKSDDLMSLL